jgi:hypothetical protein
VLIPGFWYANPSEKNDGWTEHIWPFTPVENASYGRSIRAWVADMDQDGQMDIVYSHCDTGGSHVYWVKNMGKGATWKSRQLSDPPTWKGLVTGTGSFHSLGVADFNGDGFLDIFAGEQEDPDDYMESDGLVAMKPPGSRKGGSSGTAMGDHPPPSHRR